MYLFVNYCFRGPRRRIRLDICTLQPRRAPLLINRTPRQSLLTAFTADGIVFLCSPTRLRKTRVTRKPPRDSYVKSTVTPRIPASFRGSQLGSKRPSLRVHRGGRRRQAEPSEPFGPRALDVRRCHGTGVCLVSPFLAISRVRRRISRRKFNSQTNSHEQSDLGADLGRARRP